MGPQPRPLPDPITTEDLARWKIQYQYAGSVAFPIGRATVGGLIARIEKAEADRERLHKALLDVTACGCGPNCCACDIAEKALEEKP